MTEDTISDTSDTDSTTEQQEERHVPVSALQAERTKRQALEARLAEIEQATADAARKAAEEQGEYRRLYEESAPKLAEYEKRLADFESRETARIEKVSARNAERVTALPDSLKALVPESFAPDDLAAWLDKAAPAVQARPAGTQTHGGSKANPIPPELRERVEAEAAKHGKPVDWWWKTVRSKTPFPD